MGWARGLALASLGVLLAATAIWFAHNHHRVADSARVAVRQANPPAGASALAHVAKIHRPEAMPTVGKTSVRGARPANAASAALSDDKVAQALDDYDLAANFDVLSELPKREPRVAN
jgi:hypothetical protein